MEATEKNTKLIGGGKSPITTVYDSTIQAERVSSCKNQQDNTIYDKQGKELLDLEHYGMGPL